MRFLLRHSRALTPMALVLALAPGCGADEEPVAGGGTRDAAAGGLAMDAALCTPQACQCGSAWGTRACDAFGQLGSCACAAVSLQDAQVVVVGNCPTGRYTGNFKGTAGFLIPTTDISGLELFNDQPPLQITLSPGSGSEFVVVGNGVMRGNANGTFPFEATIKGNLDCNTRQFKATLVGSVQLFLEGIRNDFTGTMEASYDTDAQAFSQGSWMVTGSSADGGSDFGLTANGSWSAAHASDAGRDAGSDAGVDAGP
jgi:hypothetical protein